jgi:DNA polymerase-3 subunit chi
MAEVTFYHLTKRPLEAVLPGLLERSLDRGWRCVVQASEERLRSLDDLLWTFSDESFLPHGLEQDDGASQPVVLVSRDANPNGAQVCFLLEGTALPENATAFERIVVLFDGNDEQAVETARERWREAKARALEATYWQQNDQGRWEKRAQGSPRG